MFPYIGGKYYQAKWITSFFPLYKYNVYAEPFGGAFWVGIISDFISRKIYYNDFNRHLFNVFSCCTNYKEFLKYLEKYNPQDEYLYNEFKKEFKKIDVDSIEVPDYELAAIYVYLATQCFSGIMSGDIGKMIYREHTTFTPFINKLYNNKIRKKFDILKTFNLSYDKFIEVIDDEETLLYVDPPYWKTEYLYDFHDFGRKDHAKLAEMLNSCKSDWILSYYEYPDMHEWYPKSKFRWEYKDFIKYSSPAKKGVSKHNGTELLVINIKKEENPFF
ncbi:MAG: DNA adenine methylase [Elusimicrobiota bacterium]